MELVANIGAGQILLADRAYDTDALLDNLAAHGAWPNVKPKSNRPRTLEFIECPYMERNLADPFLIEL